MKTVACAFCAETIAVEHMKTHVCVGINALPKSATTSASSTTAKSSSSSASDQNEPEMRKLTTSLEELFDPIAFASAPNDDDNDANDDANDSNEKKKSLNASLLVVQDAAMPECPICGRRVELASIESHVTSCLDASEPPAVAPAPAVAPVVAKQPEQQQFGQDFVNDQTRHYQMWVKRREQEEQDRLLAERMARDVAGVANAPSPSQPASAPRPSQPASAPRSLRDEELASEMLARELAAGDVSVQLEAESAALAKRLHDQEQAQIEAQRAADEASARLAAEFTRREEALARREAEQAERQARDLAVAEAAMLADERRALENERRALEDEKVARQLLLEEEREEELRKVREQFQREKFEVELRLRNENAAAEARLRHEKALLEQQLQNLHEGRAAEIGLPGIEYPAEWVQMVPHINHLLVDVRHQSEEWRQVCHYFALGARSAMVVRIQRNQNKQLWMWYQLTRQSILRKNGPFQGGNEERFLYHASRTNATETILRDGFDHRVSNLNGRLGAGIYFAASSGTSMNYLPSAHATQTMMVCRCTLGRIGKGEPGQRRPEVDRSGRMFDCAGMPDGSQYAIFENSQAYPAYLITFRR
jgi:hypothetical protein